jgi:3-hydroxy-9,10-secoandrosta-1,3,5(10)-triene-9,17-dione monooxygenase
MSASTDQRVPTREEMVDRVRALAPGFRERAAAAEKDRRLPQESFDEMLAAEAARILLPRRFGGYELGMQTWIDVVIEAGKADASHGWCTSLIIHHAHLVAQFGEEAQQAVWANGPDVSVAAAIMPACQITEDPGGYRVSGRSPFASGVAGASWAIVGGFLPGDGHRWGLFIIPPDSYVVDETWFTTGMQGTGSNTIVTDGVVVPESRLLLVSDIRNGHGPGGKLHDDPIYRAPLLSYSPLTFLTPMLGAARGAYEHFRDWTLNRKTVAGSSVADFVSIQVRLGRVAATLDAAELLMRRTAEVAETEVTAELRVRSIRDFAYVGELIVEAIDTLLQMSGAAGFAETNPIQRAWRDIHFASTHISINTESNLAHWGRTELEIEHPPTAILF